MLALRTRLAWFREPTNLLMLDFFGALATSLTTGLLLTTIVTTGLPVWILAALSITAAGYACVDLIAYFFWDEARWPLALISILNFLYCVVVAITCFVYLPKMTWVGITYFAAESAIVVPLAMLELAVAIHFWGIGSTRRSVDQNIKRTIN